MPVSPDDASNLAADMLAVYAAAEDRLTLLLARRLAQGIDAPDWATRQLSSIQGVLHDTATLARDLQSRGTLTLASIIRTSFSLGASAALRDIPASAGTQFGGVQGRAIAALIGAVRGRLEGIGPVVQSSAAQGIRLIVAQATANQLTGTATRREATALALQGFADRGITAYRSSRANGTPYSLTLASYAEMTARTQATHAIIQGHVDQLQTAGFDLVTISDAPEECVYCRPYEQKVLSSSGNTAAGRYTAANGTEYDVLCSLAEAVANKLFHPNCRHRTTIFLPGVTQLLHDTADPEGDALRQRQRLYERQVRELKRRQIVQDEIDPGGQPGRANAARLKAKQAEFKQWREDNGRKNLAYRTKPDFTQANPNSPELEAARKAREALSVETNLRAAKQAEADRLKAARAAKVSDRAAERAAATEAQRAAVLQRKAADKAEEARIRGASEDDLATELDAAFNAEVPDDALTARLEAEFDRRDRIRHLAEDRALARESAKVQAAAERAAAREAKAADKAAAREAELQRQSDEIGRLIEQEGVAEFNAVAQVTGITPQLAAQRIAVRNLASTYASVTPRMTLLQAISKAYYDGRLEEEAIKLEKAVGNAYTNAEGEARNVSFEALLSGPRAFAERYASPEVKNYFDEHGRLTLQQFREEQMALAEERNPEILDSGPGYGR